MNRAAVLIHSKAITICQTSNFQSEIGVWGNRRKQYLKQHHRVKYYNMLTQCTLYPHLADVEQRAQKMFDNLVDEMTKNEGISEQLKASDMIIWVKKMNAIKEQSAEIVNTELIFN